MDLTILKSELFAIRGNESPLISGSMAVKCVKRRRRSSYNSDNQRQKLPLSQSQVGHSVTTKRSSRFRGVSRHRWTGRFEAHLWDKGSWNPTQRKKGKQVYLGAYDEEESAARAYDLAALKYWGTSTFTNFPISDYEKEIEMMKTVTKEEYLASLRRRSSGFSRGVSKYRGVARHHHNGRWEARIGRVFGNKYLYLGTYSTQEEAARAYDIAAIEYRGINAVTNFELSTYIRWLKPEADSSASQLIEPQASPASSTIVTETSHSQSQSQTHRRIFQPNTLLTPERPVCFSNGTKSPSPTALGLLLKSSMFRELVEKNKMNVNDDENEQLGQRDDGVGGLFYDSNVKLLPLCDRRDPSHWTGTPNMCPFHLTHCQRLFGKDL